MKKDYDRKIDKFTTTNPYARKLVNARVAYIIAIFKDAYTYTYASKAGIKNTKAAYF